MRQRKSSFISRSGAGRVLTERWTEREEGERLKTSSNGVVLVDR